MFAFAMKFHLASEGLNHGLIIDGYLKKKILWHADNLIKSKTIWLRADCADLAG